MKRGMRGAWRVVREALLTVAALGGVACIVLTVLAFAGGYTLVMFKTGSMSPTIPAGSVALVREIPATEIEVGDVVTVDRSAALPVTHRVIAVGPGSYAGERTIEMKGDANAAPDPAPYVLDRSRIVIGSVPYLAHVIVWLGSPLVMGGITLGAAALVTWAFWPRASKRSRLPASCEADQRAGDESVKVTAGIPPAQHAAGALVFCVGVVTGSALLFGATPAAAAPVQKSDDALVLRSDLGGVGSIEGNLYELSAVSPLYWHVDVDASGAPSGGVLDVRLAGSGDSDLGVSAEVRSCEVPWRGDSCRSGERVLREAAAAQLNSATVELFISETPAVTYLQIALTAQPSLEADGNEQVRTTIRASASGQSEETTIGGEQPSELETTGMHGAAFIAGPAAVLLGLGIAFLARSFRRGVAGGDAGS
ncbi:MAG: signal peptidase I [Leucobacter sp.]